MLCTLLSFHPTKPSSDKLEIGDQGFVVDG
jgi:hypothetical protein